MEKMLTVQVPIHGDEDYIVTLYSMPTLGNTIENKVYKYNGIYYRRFGNIIDPVEDVEFPYIGHPLELFDFSYSSTRMGPAATITASTKWYAEQNPDDHLFYNLDGKWTIECHVTFNGQKFYLQNIPTSSKDNEDARFRYDIEFVSHWKCIERVHIFDTVAPYISERQINESETFSFFGDIKELRKRINAALVRSGLSSYKKKVGVNTFLTYTQWNNIPLGLQSDPRGYYQTYSGDYTAYLQGEVYVYEDGEFVIDGYKVIIDEGVTSEEKFISFDNNFIYDALQKICDKDNGYGLQYYYKFGTKEIHIGDCEYDFGESAAISYGIDNELLSIKKTNNTERVINTMTGKGSEENIPYFYPNPTADGWLESVFERPTGGGNLPVVTDAQPSDIYPSAAANAYEKFLKNRLGYRYEYGRIIDHIHEIGYNPEISRIEVSGQGSYSENRVVAHYLFTVSNNSKIPLYVNGDSKDTSNSLESDEALEAYLNFQYDVRKKNVHGGSLRFRALLRDMTSDEIIGQYDSFNYDDSTADDFAKMCNGNDYSSIIHLTESHTYDLSVYVYLDNVPLVDEYTYEGYYYQRYIEGTDLQNPDHYNVFDENFYEFSGLKNSGSTIFSSVWPGVGIRYYLMRRCVNDGSLEDIVATSVNEIERKKNAIYKDLSTGTLYRCTKQEIFNPSDVNMPPIFTSNPIFDIDEWVSKYLDIDIRVYNVDGWYLNGKKVDLSDYGITLTGTPKCLDNITFKRMKYLIPQRNLMPELYIKTDGERRFYNAINYPRTGGAVDTDSGEYVDGDVIKNDIYKDENDAFYNFENPHIPQLVSEDIRSYDDIKPTIKGMTNTVGGNTFRIDVAAEYDYDELDDDSIWENEADGNVQGEYKHPHFFMKLRQMPFNIFDLALHDDMEISVTSGSCGSCKFKIKVDDNTKKNPVQVWDTDVYVEKEDESLREKTYELYAAAGSLQKYTSKKVYTREVKSYIDEDDPLAPVRIYYEYTEIETHWDSMYTTAAVVNGLVGSLNTEKNSYIEGDVVTRGRFQDSQQDTSAGEVWVALEKDTGTFGTLMPAARPTYGDEMFSVYIRPKSVADTGDEDTADTFVITNIRMPQYYLRFAERQLSKKLVSDMDKDNAQKFNFTIGFSRIFLAENPLFLGNLNENSILYVSYNNRNYKQYVKSFTYKMTSQEPLPEITVDMNDELSVVYGGFEDIVRRGANNAFSRDIAANFRSDIESTIKRRFVSKTGTAIMNGNVISVKTGMSLAENVRVTNNNARKIDTVNDDIDVSNAHIESKADVLNVINDLSVIRKTIEYRFSSDAVCGVNDTEKVVYNQQSSRTEIYWTTSSGNVLVYTESACATDPFYYAK